MAFADTTWYCNAGDQSTTGYYAVAKFAGSTAYTAGQLVRQLTAPAVFNERVFVVIVAGTSSTEPAWTLTRGAKNTSGAVTFQECTGSSALNGDLTNTPDWTTQKAAGNPTLGAVIKRNSGASYQICSTAGTLGASEPAFSNTAGTTTTEGTTTWTSLGAVGNFTGGQAPHARLANALTATWFASGNTVYVGDNHAETQSSPTVLTGTSSALAKILCHNHSGSYPPATGDLASGASITVTTSSWSFQPIGSFYIRGITFSLGSGAAVGDTFTVGSTSVTQIQNWYYFDQCSFRILDTSVGNLQIGAPNATTWNVIVFNNTTVKFSNVGQFVWPLFAQFTWQNTGPILVSGSSVPSTLLNVNGTTGALSVVMLEALDLSQLTGALWGPAGAVSSVGGVTIKDCKLNAATTITQPINTGQVIQNSRSSAIAAPYVSSRHTYEAIETTEITIVRTGGALDPNGQAQSRKIVTTANAQWLRPYKAEPYAVWNTVTGSNVTVTVYGTINSGSLPNNDDIWLEVEYLSSSGSPLGVIITTTKSNLLAANAAVASDGSTWNGGGSGAGWSPFKLTTTVTPGLAGYIHVRVRAAKASATYYLDPKVVLT